MSSEKPNATSVASGNPSDQGRDDQRLRDAARTNAASLEPLPVTAADSTASPEPAAADTLDALGTLERMLEENRGLPARTDTLRTESVTEADGEYSIPLLEDVVHPGVDPMFGAADRPLVELSPSARRLFDRLASEIDVIVQSGVDEALKAAAKNIRSKVKQHVAIVLPEILDELANEDEDDAVNDESRDLT